MYSRRHLSFAALAATSILAAALTAGVSQAGAASAASTGKCNPNAIKGTWVFSEHGLVKDGQRVLPWAAAGVWTIESLEKVQGIYSASQADEVVAARSPFTGFFVQTPECVFIFHCVTTGADFDVYVLDQGTTATYFSPSVSGTMYKIQSRGDR